MTQPIASTSKVPYFTPTPFIRPFSSSPPSPSSARPLRLRLSPTTRTRLTNLSFAAAVAVSVLTVSLAMSGATSSVTGVGLPCPARKDSRGVRNEEEAAKTGGDWWKATKSRHRFMDDPVPSNGHVTRAVARTRAVEGPRTVESASDKQSPESSPTGVVAADSHCNSEGWAAWARRRVGA